MRMYSNQVKQGRKEMGTLESFTIDYNQNLLIRNALMAYKEHSSDHKEINSLIVKFDDLKIKGKYHYFYQ